MAGILRAGKYFSIYEVVHSDVAEEKGIFNLPLDEKVILLEKIQKRDDSLLLQLFL